MKSAKKEDQKVSAKLEKTNDDHRFLKLYDSDTESTIDDKGNQPFMLYKNIKISNDEKRKTLSKICCTKNHLFISTSSVFSQVRIFNYSNLVNSRKENEELSSISKSGENRQTNEKQKRINKEEEKYEQNNDGDTCISLCNIYNKSKCYTSKRESTQDNMLSVEFFNNEIKKKYIGSSESAKRKVNPCHYPNEMNSKGITSKGEKSSNINFLKKDNGKKNTTKFIRYDTKKEVINLKEKDQLELSYNESVFREEYLYYDNFAGIPTLKKETRPIIITKEMREEERDKREKEEEIEKKKKIEEENLRNEQLAKNGCYMKENILEINVDVIKRKTTQVNNLLEYVGAFDNVSSPIILMKKNKDENILSVLTYSSDVYSYDISESSLKQLKEKRIKKVELFSNIENYFIEQEKNNISNEFLEKDFGEEATASPLSVCNAHFTNSVKYFDFLPDDKTLICVGQNKDYFLSFINCYNGKKIIYHKKIKIKKPNHSTHLNSNKLGKEKIMPTLMYDFNYVCVEKEKKNFNGQIGYYVYIGSSCGYLIFTFISEKFLQFINNLLTSDEVRSGSLFTYNDGADDNTQSKSLLEHVIGNADDVYTISKNELYALFDDEHNGKMNANVNMNGPNGKDNFFNNAKENIFKEAEDNSFSYAFYISKNVKMNSIISLNTHKNEYIHLLVALNDGRLLNFLFHIYPHFTPTTSLLTSSEYYPVLCQNYVEKNFDHNKSQNNDNNTGVASIPSSINNNNFVKQSEKVLYDFTGLHKSTIISKINLYKSGPQNFYVFINSNITKICEMSDKNFYTTYMLNMYNKKIHILHEHLSYIIDSCICSHFYFCLNDNNTIAVFAASREK
ncbi:hypothetical protein, conserved [Plasmodium gonderi]|uniref:Uncharacterized protein n=1 Tax=Plasmodium gonderi TaxID=77519 RepID=A0A1Y1JMV7_PLAGO|nr:hypothetical protein, conserved [Plasmodium gonderi]GAW82557.1 hypothetical protein, conserved [Plasmodium gonderi]